MYYFVSDIHLGSGSAAEARATEQRFYNFLRDIEHDAEALFLVGDIFDFWWEYRRVVPQGFVRILGQLALMSDSGVRVVLLTGNHDMWVGDYLTRECGIEVHTEPIVEQLQGRRLFIAHGDNMNIDDKPVLKFMNRLFRSQTIRRLASWCVHPDLWVRFGRWWSGKSRKSHTEQLDPSILQPLVEYSTQYAAAHPEVDCFIYGHMHLAADVTTPQRMLFMGDWQSRANWLELNNEGNITLKIKE
jgi:UDP-2,3-diacylglucosamine hydrolase